MAAMPPSQAKIEADLRELLSEGRSMGDALRELHGPRRIGLMLLYPAVEAVTGLSKTEAKRLLVRETFDLHQS